MCSDSRTSRRMVASGCSHCYGNGVHVRRFSFCFQSECPLSMHKATARSKAEPPKTRPMNWLWQVGLVVVSAVIVFAVVRGRKPVPAERHALSPGPAPPGMAWIPGGEFSMGCVDPRDLPHGGHEAMTDARPLHRVAVDGFWID